MSEYLVELNQLRTFSRYADRLLTVAPNLAPEIAQQLNEPYSRQAMESFIREALTANSVPLKTVLRRLRQRVWLMVAARDLVDHADLAEVVATFSALAEVTVAAAQKFAYDELTEIYGLPIGAETVRPQQLIVVAMGKLGGAELNVSSDIDLIFVYPEEGETNGARSISNHEFFALLGKRLIALLAESNEDGFVFRVDMRLRPYGESGALVICFAALENYFVTQGRPWERYAFIKARPITGECHDDLAALIKPFVFRRYLDYGAVAQLRDLHSQIRAAVIRRERAHDIKLGPGGIRELEFLVQVFQLIRGGREPRLQGRSTLATLHELAHLKLIAKDVQTELTENYIFLRNLEHRLQYLDDAQTQTLPTNADDQLRIARAMGYEGYAAFLNVLNRRRASVNQQFSAVFAADAGEQNGTTASLWLGNMSAEDARQQFAQLGFGNPESIVDRLGAIRRSARYQQLPESSRTRFDALVPALIEAAGGQTHPAETLIRTLDLLETVSRREAYLALLLENRNALRRVIELVAASRWAAKYLQQHPILLDELLDHRELSAAPDWRELKQSLQHDMDAAGNDTERHLELLRHFKQTQIFQLIVLDVAGQLTLEKLSDHLSDLADCLLDVTIAAAWQSFKNRHRDAPRFAVIGYGKLGGKELGYGSDLDIIFLYEDDHPDAAENYARLAQRLNSWFSTYTASGVLYETDLRLRPDGASGLLVSSVSAFVEYQSRQAWTWEHQALTRARYCAGDGAVGSSFEGIRIEVLRQQRDGAALREEVIAMRTKMHKGHPVPAATFDLKHSDGGLVDIEFCVQYFVLAYAHRHAGLAAGIGNIALLRLCAELALIPAQLAERVADAYRELRRLQHRAWLDEQADARVPFDRVDQYAEPVRELWQLLFAGTASH
ncbi:MAG: bifunctional [glutamate--ammonia ligase]-adenylyl-L-tyrosine phosphorylase/[glutamate--ammonia-ligase] adenylyltransferase [Burkholderiales bacterium]